MKLPSIALLLLVALVVPSLAQVVNFQPENLVSVDGLLEVTLNVDRLESLNGTRFAPAYNASPIGPTIRVKPGDTLKVTLNNNLAPGTDLDRELNAYVMDPQNAVDNDVNVTIIYNRLDEIGNVYGPTYGFWGQNFQNIHFHGALFSQKEENTRVALDGGESKTYVFEIPQDAEPGFNWYHNHVHGTSAYSYLSGLFGLMMIEGTDRDIANAPGIEGATEIFMAISEGLVNEDKSVPSFFPIVGVFDWKSLTNGFDGESTVYQVAQGETILFRVVSVTVEPIVNLSIPGVTLVVVAYDGLPVPEPQEVDVVTVSGGGRVEFLVRFDEPGEYVMNRAAWGGNFNSAESCAAAFGVGFFPCISYDVDQVAATITVLPDETASGRSSADILSELELPGYSDKLNMLAAMETVGEKTVALAQALGFPIFQIPYDGPFVPPGVGFGVNNRLTTPWHSDGQVTAGACETWTVTAFPPGTEHPFHTHSARFLVTAIDGVPVEKPFWRDVFPTDGFNFTAHVCFDNVEAGDPLLVHCHMPSHQDIGMGIFYDVVAAENPGETDDSGAPLPTMVLTTTAVVAFVALSFW